MQHEDTAEAQSSGSRFRTTLVRVLIVQVVALAVLALLQLTYTP